MLAYDRTARKWLPTSDAIDVGLACPLGTDHETVRVRVYEKIRSGWVDLTEDQTIQLIKRLVDTLQDAREVARERNISF